MNTLSTPTEPGVVLEHRLSAADRCDSCGAQAYIAAEVNGSAQTVLEDDTRLCRCG